MNNKVVSIFGTGKAKEDDVFYKLAEETGKVLAKSGFTIANGGYGGTMLAAAKAASHVGGKVIGVTCTAFEKSKPNQYITQEVATSSLDKRLDTLIRLGQAYIVLPGGTGTLLEFAKVWELKNKGFLEKRKPIILIGTFWNPLIQLLTIDDPECSLHLTIVKEPKQVVQFIK
jgi:uncharacterized protein (TIGR00730 family)